MHQIGARDEARLLGRYGCCGRPLCCRQFLNALKPVPMKMAKRQKSTLDPSKISGQCGRLKCCLRFENQMYQELKKEMPRRGAQVQTEQGKGVVQDYNVISGTIEVKLEDGSRLTVERKKAEVTRS
jgi:cell fate regulator YaaT (PSP1 superfamily)